MNIPLAYTVSEACEVARIGRNAITVPSKLDPLFVAGGATFLPTSSTMLTILALS
jgi:hypothetical protein